MRKRTVSILVACVLFGAAALGVAQTQRGPGIPGGRGGFGGFARGPAVPPGPPAPVPPEVTMLRPSSEEVAKLNAELRQFIDTNKSAAKDLLKKYASLL